MLQLDDKSRCLSVVGLFIASWVRVSKRPLCGWCGHTTHTKDASRHLICCYIWITLNVLELGSVIIRYMFTILSLFLNEIFFPVMFQLLYNGPLS